MDKKKESENKEDNDLPGKKPEPSIPVEIAKQIDEIVTRLRLLEERNSGTRKKIQVTEQNMLNDAKEIFSDINVIKETITELKRELSDITEKLAKLSEEVQGSVSKADFNTLSKYLDYWQPMNFVTREEARKIIEESKNIKQA